MCHGCRWSITVTHLTVCCGCFSSICSPAKKNKNKHKKFILKSVSSVPFSPLLFRSILSTLLYSTLLYFTLLYFTLLYSISLYSTLILSTLLHSILLYSTLFQSTLVSSALLASWLEFFFAIHDFYQTIHLIFYYYRLITYLGV